MNRRTRTCIVACLLFVAAASAVPGASAATDPTVDNVEYVGDGAVPDGNESVTLWQSESHQFEASVGTNENHSDAELCLVAQGSDSDAGQQLACQPAPEPSSQASTVTLDVETWPENLTGAQELSVELRSGNDSRLLASADIEVTVIQEDGDLDDDGLSNAQEAEAGTELRDADTDNDSLTDGMEVDSYGTDPTEQDTDGDGLEDGEEVEEYQTDPTEPDTDGDGLEDAREIELGTNPNQADSDGDGLEDGAEVNEYDTDPTDPDTDGDGLDDGAEVNEYETDPTAKDSDDDGLQDNLEVDTYGTNPNEVDTDGDGLDDGEEVNEYNTDPTDEDSDDDGLADGKEVNRYDTNPNQADTDGDGLDDGEEVNKYDTDPTDPDTDGDGESDLEETQTSTSGLVTFLTSGFAIVVGLVALGGLVYLVDGLSIGGLRRRLPLGDRSSKAADDDQTETDGNPVVASGDESGLDGVSGSDDGSDDIDDIPLEFLSDEERVQKLLTAHDGRMQQSAIVEETEWSKAKTSRVLSSMAEEGTVVKVQLGRGNVVARPGELPPGIEPPDDE